ncbi:hypothetical protein MUO14_21375 [Halobacillus shinanisalinarum]|uniref:Cytosolic protein n=1 Tax=Halobacillus shinanisalinarum TaxID=2932258 RepID=A0ABY4GXQ5_9BACI|nr:hypothetical protein [Halobacillus shinanisalinarum]UOQ92923.1 hypothetical protein MUO14_21375 [Halobacillus shinanisalinarum]
MARKQRQYTDFSNVETQRNFLTVEEFVEGPYGSPGGETEPVENKETPWEDGQQFYTNFTYENRNLHQDMPRQVPGAHPTHDEKGKDTEQPYEDAPNSPNT